jgi:hypothetical protein
MAEAEISGAWCVPEAEIRAIEAMLVIYDEQIATVSPRQYCESVTRLNRVLARRNPVSPLSQVSPSAIIG